MVMDKNLNSGTGGIVI